MSAPSGLSMVLLFLALGLVFLVAGALMAVSGSFQPASACLIVAGTALVVVAGAQFSIAKKDRPAVIEDERDRHIRREAREFSWLATFLLACTMIFLDFSGHLRLCGKDAFFLVIVSLGVFASTAQLWLFRKGDVE
jgi:hypothetical protein